MGALPATTARTAIARILTIVYFAFFLLMPIYSKMGVNKQPPARVTMSTAKQKLWFFIWVAITLVGAYLFASMI